MFNKIILNCISLCINWKILSFLFCSFLNCLVPIMNSITLLYAFYWGKIHGYEWSLFGTKKAIYYFRIFSLNSWTKVSIVIILQPYILKSLIKVEFLVLVQHHEYLLLFTVVITKLRIIQLLSDSGLFVTVLASLNILWVLIMFSN